ncbi:hypothetical protein GCM10008904_31270 [Paraclostridium ghonii]|uniref:Uncharacterized protein YcfL n=1 Tax=Paraclostridium ghonii TaxID=29358 RepID=A0ABU0MX86_9FIRM|nr:hypothetical protein [Paeniclostridium ghonii]MDQ0555470.1 uncharacterized protein YcfL [Paeniclostridium ghonii]
MNNIINKTLIICTMLIVTVSMFSGCTSNESVTDNNIKVKKLEDEVESVNISEKDAKVLKIGKTEIINENKDGNNANLKLIDTKTKVTNVSDFNIRNIELTLREYDKDNTALAKTESLSKITLKPNESADIQAAHKKYAENAKVIGYSYNVGNKLVDVDLETNKVDISNTRDRIIKDTKYDILGISKPEIVNEVNGGYSSKITIKNISDKDIGSVVLQVAELNDENEYTNISYLDSYEVIKKSQEVSLISVHSEDAKNLEVIGYIYDDVKDNTTVEVNLKLNEVILLK